MPGETFDLTTAYGDWFLTSADGHASLTLRTAPHALHPAQLEIEWDGKDPASTIRAVSDPAGANRSFFYLQLQGVGAYNQTAQPRQNDAVALRVTRMDAQSLEATLSGRLTGAGPMQIAGSIKLHRSAPPLLTSGTFGQCDPEIHDKLAGAEWRSPSECEVNFDAYVRKGLAAAMQPVIDNLTGQNWKVTGLVEAQSLTSIPRHTESKPFQLVEQSMHQGGAFHVSFSLDQNSPIYQRYNQAPMDEAGKVVAAAQAGKNVPMDASIEAAQVLEENTRIGIDVRINAPSVGVTSFKAEHTTRSLPDGGFVVEVPHAQRPSGGGLDSAQRVFYVFLGAWSPAPVSRVAGEGEEITVKGNLNLSASALLKVQNIAIRIQAGTAQAEQVLKRINWTMLHQLLAGR